MEIEGFAPKKRGHGSGKSSTPEAEQARRERIKASRRGSHRVVINAYYRPRTYPADKYEKAFGTRVLLPREIYDMPPGPRKRAALSEFLDKRYGGRSGGKLSPGGVRQRYYFGATIVEYSW